MKIRHLILLCSLSCSAFADEIKTTELKLEKIIRIHGNYEPSGALIQDSKFLFVSDDLTDRQIYQLDLVTGKVADFLPLKLGLKIIDLEGLAFCVNTQTYFLANERAREIILIASGAVQSFFIDDEDVHKGSINAGFEGVAVDCEKNILYAAKERDPRFLYAVDLTKIKNGEKIKPMEKFDLPFSSEKTPDFADLFFADGKLLVLERNIHQITVWDPSTKKIAEKYSYAHVRDHEFDDNKNGKIERKERGLFDTKEPYGLAEGLVIDDKHIYILLDNNGKSLSKWASKKYKFEQNADPIVLQFKVP